MGSISSPICLSIAGSDNSGGAGIQADLRTFHYFACVGMNVVTAVTAQNSTTVFDIQPLSGSLVRKQFNSIVEAFPIQAIKIGMLPSTELIEAVADCIESHTDIPIVIDPILNTSSGLSLMDAKALECLQKQLLPHASLITPNIPEVETLLTQPCDNEAELIASAQALQERYRTSVVITGGHGNQLVAKDILVTKNKTYTLSSPRQKLLNSHGTGCLFSAAITAQLALEKDLCDSVFQAKVYVYNSLRTCHQFSDDGYSMTMPAQMDRRDIHLDCQ